MIINIVTYEERHHSESNKKKIKHVDSFKFILKKVQQIPIEKTENSIFKELYRFYVILLKS